MVIEVYKLNNCSKKYKDRQYIKAKVIDKTGFENKEIIAYVDTRSIVCKFLPNELTYERAGFKTTDSGISFIREEDLEKIGGIKRIAVIDDNSEYVENINEAYYNKDQVFKFRSSGNKYYHYVVKGTKVSWQNLVKEIARKLSSMEELSDFELFFIFDDFGEILKNLDYENSDIDKIRKSSLILSSLYYDMENAKFYINKANEQIRDIIS